MTFEEANQLHGPHVQIEGEPLVLTCACGEKLFVRVVGYSLDKYDCPTCRRPLFEEELA